MSDVRSWRNVETLDDLPDGFDLEKAVEDTLDWFTDRRGVPSQEFIDRFVRDHGGSGYDPSDWDLDSYDSPVARAILREARRQKREQG